MILAPRQWVIDVLFHFMPNLYATLRLRYIQIMSATNEKPLINDYFERKLTTFRGVCYYAGEEVVVVVGDSPFGGEV